MSKIPRTTEPASEDNEFDERAEATKEVAKAASKAIDSANAVGRFLDRIFGDLVEDTVGLAGDSLRAYRLRRLADLQKKTEGYLAAKGVVSTEPISPRIGYRIVQEATLEDDEELQARFARLLAEALDPDGEKITRRHSDVIAELTSASFLILDYCWRVRHKIGHRIVGSPDIRYEDTQNDALAVRKLTEVVKATQVTEDDIRHVIGLGLFRPTGDEFHVFPWTRSSMGDVRVDERLERVTIYGDIQLFEFTEFGLSFCRAVIAS